jgi:hypothetical protein
MIALACGRQHAAPGLRKAGQVTMYSTAAAEGLAAAAIAILGGSAGCTRTLLVVVVFCLQ